MKETEKLFLREVNFLTKFYEVDLKENLGPIL